jgi:hypothetical protein
MKVTLLTLSHCKVGVAGSHCVTVAVEGGSSEQYVVLRNFREAEAGHI